MPRTSHKCTACNNPLTYLIEDSTVVVWCDMGRCPSAKANDGIKGFTGYLPMKSYNQRESVDTLALKLIEQLKDDPDW